MIMFDISFVGWFSYFIEAARTGGLSLRKHTDPEVHLGRS